MKLFSQLKSEINESVNRTHVVSKIEDLKEKLCEARADSTQYKLEEVIIDRLRDIQESIAPSESLHTEIESLIRNDGIVEENLIKISFSKIEKNHVFRHGGDWYKKITNESFGSVATGKRHYHTEDMPEFVVYQDSSDLLGETRFKLVNEDIANAVGDAPGHVAGVSDNDPPVWGNGKFGKDCLFDVDSDTFSKCRQGKKKFARWSKYIDKTSDQGKKIYEYANKYKQKSIVLRHKDNGLMLFARRK